HAIRAYRPRANPFEPRHDIVHGVLLHSSRTVGLARRVARRGRKHKPLEAARRRAAGLATGIRIKHASTLREQPSRRWRKCANMMATGLRASGNRLGKGSYFSPEAPARLRRSRL